MRKKNVTRNDVAAKAGISIATVSNVLSGKTGIKISAGTREKVLKAAKELDYHASYIGRALKARRSFNMGVLFSDIHQLEYRKNREILAGMNIRMQKEFYNILLFFRNENRDFLESIRAGRTDGLFVFCDDIDDELILHAHKYDIPLVVINHPDADAFTGIIPKVTHDYWGMCAGIVAELVSRKYRKLLLLNTCEDPKNRNINRLVAHECRSTGLEFDFMELKNPETASAGLENILRSETPPDVVLVNRLNYARLCHDVAVKNGVRCPDELRLITWEPDKVTADFPITIYKYDGEILGQKAWDVMSSLMNDRQDPPVSMLIPFIKLVIDPSSPTGKK